jgi:enamine deaminase RidA (YjgF/YER057c/UK114 family)
MPQDVAGLSPQDVQVRELPREAMREIFVTGPGTAAALVPAAEHLGRDLAAVVLSAECFGPRLNGDQSAVETALAHVLPLTWVLGGVTAAGLGGVHLRAVAGAQVRPLEMDGRLIGTVVAGPYATEVMLGGIYAPDPTAARDRQARLTFESIEQALALAGMDFSHVARTWLFLDDILSWYGDFNRVRTDFFRERGVFDGVVPASTGIGGSNPAGAAMVAGAYAVKPHGPDVTVTALPSPLQCPAPQYGSSFSRAVEVAMPDMRRVLVSGTASIAPGGETQHVGDVQGQTARTCEVVAAILESRGMGWEDVTRATAYVRFPQDAGAFEDYRQSAGLPPLPVVVAHNVICRDDLLFEIEVDAVQSC